MNKLSKIFLTVICAALLAIPVGIAGCAGNDNPNDPVGSDEIEVIDYVSDLKLDFTSSSIKQEVTVRQYVDGDTTHFDPVKNSSITPGVDLSAFNEISQGYVKARYIAINTPESTGKIEKWGKTASNFTHDKLAGAKTIIIESDDDQWNVDSTGGRFVLWVWYLNEGETEYRNLNVEILQAGLAYASATSTNRYGTVASAALAQAQALKLCCYSPASTIDENYFDGDAYVLSLKELRCHIEDYVNMPVRVSGVVVAYYNYTIYLQDYDAETDMYYGINIFDGYATGDLVKLFSIGNEVSACGKITKYESTTNDVVSVTYQMSDISYSRIKPKDSDSKLLSENNEIVFTEVSAKDIVSGTVSIDFYDEEADEPETVEMNYGEAIMSTTVQVSNLTVLSGYVTSNGGSNDGAISFTCLAEDGTEIVVRTEVLYDANNNLLNKNDYVGKVITVKGLIEKYNNKYQVKCYRTDYLEIVG